MSDQSMTDAEINRKFDVVAGHLASFAVGLDQLTGKIDQLAGKVDQLADSQQHDTRRLDRVERVMKLMVRAGLRARRGMREQDERITALIDSQIHTEEIARTQSEGIATLAEIVRQLATKQNGNGKS